MGGNVSKRKMAAIASSKRMNRPTVIVAGVERGRMVTIQPGEFKRLQVDESYQRIRIKQHVNDLINVIQRGGMIADPVSLAERPGNPNLYIVDGQQRFWAHSECGVPMAAIVYAVKDLDSERALFLALNNSISVSSNTTVRAWDGESAEMVRAAAAPGGVLAGRVTFAGPNGGIDATVLVKGMAAAAANVTFGKKVSGYLTRLDHEFASNKAAKDRAEAFLRLAASAFEPQRQRMLTVQALGLVAHKRWKSGYPSLPPERVLSALRRVNWDVLAPTWASKWLPLFREKMEAIWK